MNPKFKKGDIVVAIDVATKAPRLKNGNLYVIEECWYEGGEGGECFVSLEGINVQYFSRRFVLFGGSEFSDKKDAGIAAKLLNV